MQGEHSNLSASTVTYVPGLRRDSSISQLGFSSLKCDDVPLSFALRMSFFFFPLTVLYHLQAHYTCSLLLQHGSLSRNHTHNTGGQNRMTCACSPLAFPAAYCKSPGLSEGPAYAMATSFRSAKTSDLSCATKRWVVSNPVAG